MSNIDKNLTKILDAEILSVNEDQLPVVVNNNQVVVSQNLSDDEIDRKLKQDMMEDYDLVRENFKEMIEKGNEAFDDLMKIAKESEHPRAFEVAASIFSNIADVNEKLIEMKKKMKDITGRKSASTVNVDKAIFTGNSLELLKLMKEQTK